MTQKSQKQTKEKIKVVVDRIARRYKPEKIILFGSFAWGKPTKDSDVDLLIIKNTKMKFMQRHMKVRHIIDGELPIDLLIRTPKEVRQRLTLEDFFYQDIINKGKYLYEKK